MEQRLIVLPPVKDRVRTALLSLADFKDVPSERLKAMARQVPGATRVFIPDRLTAIVLLLGTRQAELN